MAHPLPTSPLLALPAELRLQIYGYAVTADDNYFMLEDTGYYYHPGTASWIYLSKGMHKRCRDLRKQQAARYLSILYTCRQVYAEACLLPFQYNTLVFNSYTVFSAMRTISEERWRAITALRLVVGIIWHEQTFQLGHTSLDQVLDENVLASLTGLKSLEIAIMIPHRPVRQVEWVMEPQLRRTIRPLSEFLMKSLGEQVACTFYALNGDGKGFESREIVMQAMG